MSMLKLGLNQPSPAAESEQAAEAGESGGLNTGALAAAPKYGDFVPSMHSNMTMTSPLPPKEPEYAPDAALDEKVVAVLKTCYDPEIPIDIYQLGLIYKVRLDPDDRVFVTMTLTSPNCPAAGILPSQVESVVMLTEGVTDARVEITFDPPFTIEMMSEEAKLELGFL